MDLAKALDVLAPSMVVYAGCDATPEARAAWEFLLAERDRLGVRARVAAKWRAKDKAFWVEETKERAAASAGLLLAEIAASRTVV